jgi:hypothetical protein
MARLTKKTAVTQQPPEDFKQNNKWYNTILKLYFNRTTNGSFPLHVKKNPVSPGRINLFFRKFDLQKKLCYALSNKKNRE